MEMLQGVWKQHLRPRAVVGYGFKVFLPSPPNYVTRSPGKVDHSRPQTYVLQRTDFNTDILQAVPVIRVFSFCR